MGINLKNVVVSAAVGAVVSGLLTTNLNAITATTTYGTAARTIASSITSSTVMGTIPNTASTTASSTLVYTNLDAWLEDLAMKESHNQERIKVLDVNGRYSYGCLQFQMATFKSYSTRYGLVDPNTVVSWEELLYNCSLQKKIAKHMILENNSNWRHWGYTVLKKGVGLPPTVEVVIDKQVAIAQ